MRTLRRLIYGEIITAVMYVLLGFVSLFFFFDLVEELPAIGQASAVDQTKIYDVVRAVTYVLLLVPSRVYELLPITVLIGSVFVLTRLAHSSEFTILRTSGLGPWKALRILLTLGAVFVLLTFAIGDYLAPLADRAGQLLKAQYQGQISVGQTGAWLKEKQNGQSYSVNVHAMNAKGELQEVRIFEFNAKGRIRSLMQADLGQVGDGSWTLSGVRQQVFDTENLSTAQVKHQTHPTWVWPTSISAEMVSVALLKPERMRTIDLFTYIRHLEANNQTAQRYEIEFWRKVFYPMSCLVMMVLALPFAYLHFRSGGVTGYVFMGVMIGISFFLLNNVFGYIGNLRAWQPWVAAASPALLYTLASLGAFSWLVLRR